MKTALRILLVLVAILLLALGGFVVWGSTPAAPMPEALAALESDSQVTVSTTPWLDFAPASGQAEVGLIYYPGGRVDYRAYAPMAHALAAAGYRVIIPAMPLSLAVLAPDKAAEIIQAVPEVKIWAVGGHSLGGAMAATFLNANRDQAQGLVLVAAYPAGSDDLSAASVKVISISAAQDGLATPDKIAASRALLPADTAWLAIEGGNHAQFGWYGDQSGDLPASITRQAQQEQVITAIADFLLSLKEQP